VSGSLVPTRDPYTYDLTATVHTGRSLRAVEDAILAQLEQMADGSITEEELEKAVKQSKAQFAYAAEHVTNQAYWLGWTETIASYQWFEGYIERLLDVSMDDVQRAARTYLVPANRTTGWYVPLEEREGA
jgi:zinc protease